MTAREPTADLATRRLRAVAHPTRLDMLSLLTGASLSAAEVARELGITQANASYHLRHLHAAGLLEIVGHRQVNGGRATLYRHPWQSPEPGGQTGSEAAKQAQVRVMADAIPRRFTHREPGGGAFCDADVWVSPQVWAQATDLVERASALVHRSAQPPRSPGAVRVNLSIAAFPMRFVDGGSS